MYEAQPVAIAHDLHPDYLSTRWAQDVADDCQKGRPQGSPLREAVVLNPQSPIRNPQSSPLHDAMLIPVQHHHAHLASVLAENQIDGPALGVIWDGTGFGTDGTVWGGEFLLGDAAQLSNVWRPCVPSGCRAAMPRSKSRGGWRWRCCGSLLGDAALGREDLAPIHSLSANERFSWAKCWRKGIHAPVTTSAGRLFDGVAALLGLQQTVSLRARRRWHWSLRRILLSLMRIRSCWRETTDDGRRTTGSLVRPWCLTGDPCFRSCWLIFARHVAVPVMAARFHNALIDAIVAVALAIGEPRVAFSGGCFQNRLLVERAARRLRQAGFEVILHRQVPPNDGGISLGQIAVASARMQQ